MSRIQNISNNGDVAFIPLNISNISSGRNSSQEFRQQSDSNIFVNQYNKSKLQFNDQNQQHQHKNQQKNNELKQSQNQLNDTQFQQPTPSQKNNNFFSSSHNSILQLRQYVIKNEPNIQNQRQLQNEIKHQNNKFQQKNQEQFVYGPKHFHLSAQKQKKYRRPITMKDSNKQKQSFSPNNKIKGKSPVIKNIQNTAIKSPIPLSLSIYSSYSSHHSQPNNDQHTFTKRMTETDVISQQKQQFLEEEVESINMNPGISRINDQNNLKKLQNFIYDNLKQFDQTKQKIVKRVFEPKVTIVKTQIYEQKQIQQNALYNNVLSSYNHLQIQLKDLILFNRANQIQIQKAQTKQKIIETELLNNDLKIFLRKAQQTKHINFCTDFQYGRQRCKYLNVRKKVDPNLRNYCQQLESKIQQEKLKQTKLSEQFRMLELYYDDFKQKVNFSHIFKQRKIQTLVQQAKLKLKIKKRHLSKSPSFKSSQVMSIKHSKNSQGSQIGSNRQINSITSIQNKNRQKLFNTPKNKLRTFNSFQSQGTSLFQIQSQFQNPSKVDTMTGIRRKIQTDINFDEYQLWKIQSENQKDNHHCCQKNTNNARLQKYFYYECQQDLKQMIDDIQFGTNLGLQEKYLKFSPKVLSKNHRKILINKMELIQNQILDIEVDNKQKIKEMQKQNQILKKEHLMLVDLIFMASCDNTQLNDKKSKQIIKIGNESSKKIATNLLHTIDNKQVKSYSIMPNSTQDTNKLQQSDKSIKFNKIPKFSINKEVKLT